MNAEFCEDNSGSSKKKQYFLKKMVGGGEGEGGRETGPSPGSATGYHKRYFGMMHAMYTLRQLKSVF